MTGVRVVPKICGPVQVTGAHAAARSATGASGDIYEVTSTPFGVRAIIADVTGHGDEAAPLASDVLGAFRRLAEQEARITGLAARLDLFVASKVGVLAERFVTAVLVEIPDGTADVVSCGHPPPLIMRGGRAMELAGLDPAPPLGLQGMYGGWCGSLSTPFANGDSLLLYTDGATEARSPAGEMYPFAERAARLLADDPADCVARLGADLLSFTGGHPHDDVALLCLRR
jgi:serine phosphatase RsbU (regulator of sigma subunit)